MFYPFPPGLSNRKKKKRTQLRRSDPKSLQKEDSDTVWNELTYFKKENKNLMVERFVKTLPI